MWEMSDPSDPNWQTNDWEADPDIEYVRVIRPKRRRWTAWLDNRFRDGDFTKITEALNAVVMVAACVTGLAAVIWLSTRSSPYVLQSDAYKRGFACLPLAILLRWIILRTIRRGVARHGSKIIEDRWLYEEESHDAGEGD